MPKLNGAEAMKMGSELILAQTVGKAMIPYSMLLVMI